MRDAAEGYREIRKLASDLGAVLQMSVTVGARNDGSKDTHSLWAEEKHIKDILRDPQNRIAIKRDVNLEEILDSNLCGAGIVLLHVNPYGDVLPCVAMQRVAGNIRETPIGEIWKNGPIFQELRELRLRDMKVCPRCRHVLYCPRCSALAYVEDGDLLGRSTNACRLAKWRYEVESERRSA